ncbi:hypothetical protein BRC85_05845 [Halobacteriales archaeon QS_1_69_70]|nr:MAG: hypothetical protein BRC85_05845 [Halobacteriales archaeon QS_1_69_70]
MWGILPKIRILGEVVPANGRVVPNGRVGGVEGDAGGATSGSAAERASGSREAERSEASE